MACVTNDSTDGFTIGGAGCSDSDVFRDMQERIYGWCVRQRRTVGSEGVDQ